ncbi:hypothetical protein EXN66_Car003784 [Channa argus]|uniref:Uncharacterized protein n=1 Tax=Channa argus TaxID=215402 RepID=A0A6G1PCZ3_CHAAH|nr:hypothetical protein EXN66_Car003784 [Channa argus]
MLTLLLKMTALCWKALLIVFLSAGNSSPALGKNQLARIVDEILNRYRLSYEAESTTGRVTTRYPMFSLAVSLPYDKEKQMYDFSSLDSGEEVRRTILNCDVYTGRRVVAATVLRWPNVLSQCPDGHVPWPHILKKCPAWVKTWSDVNKWCTDKVPKGTADHAEYRTLQKLNTLANNDKSSDLLLFYVLASPCDKRCTSETSHRSILNSINQIVNWVKYAVVFSDVFQPRDGPKIPETELRDSLMRLGTNQVNKRSIGLNNIFRCNGNPVQCTSCSSNNQVSPYCYSDEASSPNLPPI